MIDLIGAIPDSDVLISLEPEELGAKLLFLLKNSGKDTFNIHNIIHFSINDGSSIGSEKYPKNKQSDIKRALFEAWNWLEVQGFLVWSDEVNGRNGMRRLSRMAERYTDEVAMINYISSLKLPRQLLHPRLRSSVWLNFVRGEYDAAILLAFKEVEICVRNAGGYQNSDYGMELMRKAFHKSSGSLTDKDLTTGEQESMQHLFAGAIGTFKNPQSHRHVGIIAPEEAAEMIMTASYLLRIVDKRAKSKLSSNLTT